MRQGGIVRSVAEKKGFGFITPDDGSPDLFFHRSALAYGDFEMLRVGQRVTFESHPSDKGPRAERVEIVRG